ncbi:MAG: hypothetical protein M1827_006622 [Pycnora praestabilis]|nr:MAG: hypothetical protein M1827_006622 [Pycnora praestabilis]
MKRSLSPNFTANPLIKRKNRDWEVSPPTSLAAPVSPPRSKPSKKDIQADVQPVHERPPELLHHASNLAAIEAGEARIRDHLAFFSEYLKKVTKAPLPQHQRLRHEDFVDLYSRNQYEHGHHFVVHQHDHPVAGVHYDLRLQFSESSSISFAIMYGLPGHPNGKRLNRNASETRVHNLWNHLIETASLATGSLLIWDIGEYSILPWRPPENQTDSDSSLKDSPNHEHNQSHHIQASLKSESEKLQEAFRNRKIRIRLHGTRLPPNYTLSLRLPSFNNRFTQPKKPVRKRRRRTTPFTTSTSKRETPPPSSAESGHDTRNQNYDQDIVPSTPGPPSGPDGASTIAAEVAEQEDEEVRLTNAYPGATNTIGSIHQRRWYLSLDRANSGFDRTRDKHGKVRWVRKAVTDSYSADNGTNERGVEKDGAEDELLGFEPFFVRGRDHEVSVITGRSADNVMADEGVEGFVGRKGWKPVLE